MPARLQTARFRSLAAAALTAAIAMTAGLTASGQTGNVAGAPLAVADGHFTLRGQPFQILSGELEYARIPRAYWRDRLRKAHAMGLNTITVYVFWNLHEPTPGHFDFSGQNDVAEYLREAQAEGLNVILRPGPYVCAEWDLGGYPAWLLKDLNMILRSRTPQFTAAAERWMLRLGQELAPLQASKGGPIIAVQVENEYGSFGDDHAYMQWMKSLVRRAGFTSTWLYTADGADVMEKGSLPDLPAGVDLGTGDAERSVALLKKFRPGAPVYVAEYWDGWFDHWGEKHQTTSAEEQEAEIRSMVTAGDSVSLYMVHGGTSFGWMNGANSGGKGYQPDVSSYDYDAPLDESGRPRPKYFEIRKILSEATHTTPPAVPDSPPLITLPAIRFTQAVPLWDALPTAVTADKPRTMEQFDQAYGYILYRTNFDGTGPAQLSIPGLHSYARVYLDGQLQGTIDRRLGEKNLAITAKGQHRLDILVENSGRINFTPALRGERAGILGDVAVNGQPLHNWQMFSLPFTDAEHAPFQAKPCNGPCLLQASFNVAKPGDTFLNTSHLSKGVAWVNGHLLGRFWNVGPTQFLYLPGPWLHAGVNQLTVFDLDGGPDLTVTGDDHQTYIDPKAPAQP